MVLPARKRGGYSYRKQVLVGSRPGGGRHQVDIAAEKSEAANQFPVGYAKTGEFAPRLSQWRDTRSTNPFYLQRKMVEQKGFEPSTPTLRTWCSPS